MAKIEEIQKALSIPMMTREYRKEYRIQWDWHRSKMLEHHI